MATKHTVDEVVPFSAFDLPGTGRGGVPDRAGGTPGVTFCYHQWATYTLAEIVRRATGGLRSRSADRVFGALGITDASWDTDVRGRIWAGRGPHVHGVAREVLPDAPGRWGGRGRRLLEGRSTSTGVPRRHQRVVGQPGLATGLWVAGVARPTRRGDARLPVRGRAPRAGHGRGVHRRRRPMQAVLDRVWEHLFPVDAG